MFSPNVVGFANALAGGWGNAGMLLIVLDHPVLCNTLLHYNLQTQTQLLSVLLQACWGMQLSSFASYYITCCFQSG